MSDKDTFRLFEEVKALTKENERLRATIARVEAKALEELGKGPADDFGLGRKDAMRDVRMVLQLRTGVSSRTTGTQQ